MTHGASSTATQWTTGSGSQVVSLCATVAQIGAITVVNYNYRIQPNKRTVRLKKIGQRKNVKESVLNVHQNLLLYTII